MIVGPPHALTSFGSKFLGRRLCFLWDFTPLRYDPDRVEPVKMQDVSTSTQNGRTVGFTRRARFPSVDRFCFLLECFLFALHSAEPSGSSSLLNRAMRCSSIPSISIQHMRCSTPSPSSTDRAITRSVPQSIPDAYPIDTHAYPIHTPMHTPMQRSSSCKVHISGQNVTDQKLQNMKIQWKMSLTIHG